MAQTILVVDDEVDVRRFLAAVLEKRGYDVVTAEDGRQAYGIAEQEREKIFDRFYQVDSTTTRPYRGTGLGLTICKHIVEYHQGRIWAESEEGKGSTFFFTLPKELQAEEAIAIDFTTLPPRRE